MPLESGGSTGRAPELEGPSSGTPPGTQTEGQEAQPLQQLQDGTECHIPGEEASWITQEPAQAQPKAGGEALTPGQEWTEVGTPAGVSCIIHPSGNSGTPRDGGEAAWLSRQLRQQQARQEGSRGPPPRLL